MKVARRALSGGAAARWLGDGSLTKKAYLNALTEALDYGARLAVGFLITPLLVAGLGSYQYGLWQILSRLIDYVSAASGRPTQALKWVIARRRSATDEQEKRRYVGSAVVVWVLFLPLLVTLGGLVAWSAPLWLGTSAEVSSTVRLAAALLVAYVILTGLADIPQAVIEGENLRYKRMALSAALVLVGGGLTALAVLLDGGLVGVAVANLAYPLLSGILFLKIVRTYAPWFRVVLPSRAEARAFLGLSSWFLLWRLVNLLLMASDVIVLGKLGSVEAVSTYTLTKYSPETLISMIAIVVYGISPGLGGIVGSGDLQKAARVRGEIMVGTWPLAIAIGATIVIWNQAFVGLWVGPEHYDQAPSRRCWIMLTVVRARPDPQRRERDRPLARPAHQSAPRCDLGRNVGRAGVGAGRLAGPGGSGTVRRLPGWSLDPQPGLPVAGRATAEDPGPVAARGRAAPRDRNGRSLRARLAGRRSGARHHLERPDRRGGRDVRSGVGARLLRRPVRSPARPALATRPAGHPAGGRGLIHRLPPLQDTEERS